MLRRRLRPRLDHSVRNSVTASSCWDQDQVEVFTLLLPNMHDNKPLFSMHLHLETLVTPPSTPPTLGATVNPLVLETIQTSCMQGSPAVSTTAGGGLELAVLEPAQSSISCSIWRRRKNNIKIKKNKKPTEGSHFMGSSCVLWH